MSASDLYTYFFAVSRWLLAGLSVLLILSWISYYRKNKSPNQVFAEFWMPDGRIINVFRHESIIGRGAKSDINIPATDIKKRHAVLYTDDGQWIIAPVGGKISVNMLNVSRPAPIYYGDKLTVSGCTLTFKNHKECADISSHRPIGAGVSLFLLTVFQIVLLINVCLKLSESKEMNVLAPFSFLLLIVCEWVYFLVGKRFESFKMLFELPALYLSSIGLTVCACDVPERLKKQLLSFVIGFIMYVIFTLLLKFFPARSVFQRIAMAGSVGILYITAIFGSEINSSKNWLVLGPVSFQPSELCKAAFVFVGCAALYTVVLRPKRQWEFIIYSVACMGALALMLDFGAVAIFFVGMIILLAIRLTSPVITGGICLLFGITGAALLVIYPYIGRRFSVWLHAWEYAGSTGYQQTRTMIASASGGILGVGPGNGYLTSVSASETDLVFGVVCEELGSIIALTVALCFIALGMYAYRLAKNADSLFYSCGVSAAAIMLIFQAALNIFGSLDLLPLTGVTLVFVSCGGTSVMSAWLMLSFFKVAEISHRAVDGWRDFE